MRDNNESNINVWMLHPALDQAPTYSLPDGYTIRTYEAGDLKTWVDIQQQSDPFIVPTQDMFFKYMPDSAKWSERILFLATPTGKSIGTITAWNDAEFIGHDIGLIHWLAIKPEARGHGLARPLLSAALKLLLNLGYKEAWLETGSGRIPAINLYLHFGFTPLLREQADIQAWQGIAHRLHYPVILPVNDTSAD